MKGKNNINSSDDIEILKKLVKEQQKKRQEEREAFVETIKNKERQRVNWKDRLIENGYL